MVEEVLQVGHQRIRSHGQDVLQGPSLVVGGRLPHLDLDGPLRALADAGPQAVAGDLRDEPRLAVDHLQGPLGATAGAETAAIALRFENPDDLAFHSSLHASRIPHPPGDALTHIKAWRIPERKNTRRKSASVVQ